MARGPTAAGFLGGPALPNGAEVLAARAEAVGLGAAAAFPSIRFGAILDHDPHRGSAALGPGSRTSFGALVKQLIGGVYIFGAYTFFQSRPPPMAHERHADYRSQHSESGRHKIIASGGQARPYHPAVRSRVVDLHRAKTHPAAEPAKDVDLATHRCGGVTVPSGAHAR